MQEEDIVEVMPVEEDETYDIEIEHEHHSFFANDISVSNSHGLSYSVISFQCAWFLTYFPTEWLCSFLNEESTQNLSKAISIVKSLGYKILEVDVNMSGDKWIPNTEHSKTLIQPLTSIKGFGEKAMEQVIANRPFETIEDLLFNSKIKYQKLNKKALDVLVRSGACSKLMNSEFRNFKHFWLSTVFNRPKSKASLYSNIEKFKDEIDFSNEEKITNILELTGIFPISTLINEKVQAKLDSKKIPSISEYDDVLKLCWFVPRKLEKKLTKNKKMYWELHVADGVSGKDIKVKCWNPREADSVKLNRPHMAKLDFDDKYGFSVTWPNKNIICIG